MRTMENETLTPIQTFYNGRKIFITGSTGFLGNVLLAKLLTSCPGINTIYLLVNKTSFESDEKCFQRLFPEPILKKVKTKRPNYRELIRFMLGNCLESRLGLSQDDYSTLKNEVDVIFHVAATINFLSPLDEACALNMAATEDLLKIATDMPQLKIFLHVSTAYVNMVGNDTLEEKFYDTPFTPENILHAVKLLDKRTLTIVEPSLIGQYQNSYFLTKSLAEKICQKYWTTVPLIIFRPAIVLSTYEEPECGWINGNRGPIAIFAATILGILRTLHLNYYVSHNIVPCDYVINCMLASACVSGESLKMLKDKNTAKTEPARIYNFGSSSLPKKHTWSEIIQTSIVEANKIPSNQAIGIISLNVYKSRFMYRLFVYVFHLLPALAVDAITKLAGKPSRWVHRYRKVQKLMEAVCVSQLNEWHVRNDNARRLYESLSERDKLIFNFDIDRFDWDLYGERLTLGVRRFIFKEDMETLSMAKKRQIWLLVLNRFAWSIFAIGLFYVVRWIIILFAY